MNKVYDITITHFPQHSINLSILDIVKYELIMIHFRGEMIYFKSPAKMHPIQD